MARHRAVKHQFLFAVTKSYKWKAPKKELKNQWRELDNQLKTGNIDYDTWVTKKANIWFISSSGDFFQGYKCKESYKESLQKFAKLFGDWIQKTYGIKYIKDITPEMAQKFLETKAKEGVHYSTLRKYTAMIKALALASQKSFNKDLNNPSYIFNFAKGIHVPIDAVRCEDRTMRIDPAHYEKIINSDFFRNSKSTAKIGIPLARHFGLRVSELSRLCYNDIAMSFDEIPQKLQKFVIDKSPYDAYLIIRKGKGGVYRVIPALSKEEYILLSDIKKECISKDINKNNWIIPVKRGAINKFFRECLKRNDLSYYIDHKISIHGLRKLRASELFLQKLGDYYLVEEIGNEKEKIYYTLKKAGKYVDRYLGHETSTKAKANQDTMRMKLVRRYQIDVISPEDIASRLSECGADYNKALSIVNEILSEL
ncbi:tyrosine-type recombinase/integrase [Methanothermococcus okinawensis]|uniref:Integrase family protein n=1 Tax=Methanothermococcus okinawensis (strain DSM 14208 / JCM 11175 / IH1) TaxID=647113 RepID=F8AP16_METOI|nr:tyrosine-type recombinase/integrase [Methanothermococcus okinawensis]AEH07584.1 integrase family protein [Methanothermococcus okinawensis IH1]